MKNSKKVLEKIDQIPNLEKEIALITASNDFEMMYKSDINNYILIGKIGNTNGLSKEQVIETLAESYMEDTPYMGYCYSYWSVKKMILKEKYNINWYSPDEEEPSTLFD